MTLRGRRTWGRSDQRRGNFLGSSYREHYRWRFVVVDRTMSAADDRAKALAEWDRWYDSRPTWLEAVKTEGIWWHIEQARNAAGVQTAPETEEQ